MKITQLNQIKACEGKQGEGCWDIWSPMTTNQAENKPAPLPPAVSPETGPLLAVPSLVFRRDVKPLPMLTGFRFWATGWLPSNTHLTCRISSVKVANLSTAEVKGQNSLPSR